MIGDETPVWSAISVKQDDQLAGSAQNGLVENLGFAKAEVRLANVNATDRELGDAGLHELLGLWMLAILRDDQLIGELSLTREPIQDDLQPAWIMARADNGGAGNAVHASIKKDNPTPRSNCCSR